MARPKQGQISAMEEIQTVVRFGWMARPKQGQISAMEEIQTVVRPGQEVSNHLRAQLAQTTPTWRSS